MAAVHFAAFTLDSHGGTMTQRKAAPLAYLLFAAVASAGCAMGPSASGTFDRTLSVSGPIRLELNNTSGDVSITGSTDGKVHIHGTARASGIGFESPDKRLSDLLANPPIEQHGATIRIGEEMRRLRNVSVSYMIEVPHETEITSRVLSGAQDIQNVRGPVKAEAASGSVDVEGATSDVKAHAASGRVNMQGNPGASSYWDLKTASGSVQLGVPANASFHLAAEAISGEIKADIPIMVEEQGKHSLRARVGNGNGGRIEVHTVSGEIRLRVS